MDRRQADLPVALKSRTTDGERSPGSRTSSPTSGPPARRPGKGGLRRRPGPNAGTIINPRDRRQSRGPEADARAAHRRVRPGFRHVGRGRPPDPPRKRPDLVLSDVMMPGMDGHELCRRIKAEETIKHTPVLLVTARSASEMLAAGIESGADDYIVKPFNAVELKARIRSHLRMRQVESELALANRNLKMRTNRPRRAPADAVHLDGQVARLRPRSEGFLHPAPLGPGHRILPEDRPPHGIRRTGARRPRAGRPAPRRGQDRHSREHPQQARPADLRKIKPIKDHPVFGEGILSPVIELTQIAKVVRSHHEKYDGTGYPDGLKGLEIPLGARIMTVADAYDAITSKRPYRERPPITSRSRKSSAVPGRNSIRKSSRTSSRSRAPSASSSRTGRAPRSLRPSTGGQGADR